MIVKFRKHLELSKQIFLKIGVRLTVPDFMTYYEATTIKTVGHWQNQSLNIDY